MIEVNKASKFRQCSSCYSGNDVMNITICGDGSTHQNSFAICAKCASIMMTILRNRREMQNENDKVLVSCKGGGLC